MNGRLRRICLVADSGLIGEALADRFVLEGFSCDWFRSGETARAALAHKEYDVAVCDIGLPGANGAALSGAAGGAALRLPPCIFINANGAIERPLPLPSDGIREYLPGPLDIRVLLAKVRTLCTSRSLEPSGDAAATAAQQHEAPPRCVDSQEWVPLSEHMRACERRYIEWALKVTSGRIGESAAVLGISRKNLWERMRKLQMHGSREHTCTESRCDLQNA